MRTEPRRGLRRFAAALRLQCCRAPGCDWLALPPLRADASATPTLIRVLGAAGINATRAALWIDAVCTAEHVSRRGAQCRPRGEVVARIKEWCAGTPPAEQRSPPPRRKRVAQLRTLRGGGQMRHHLFFFERCQPSTLQRATPPLRGAGRRRARRARAVRRVWRCRGSLLVLGKQETTSLRERFRSTVRQFACFRCVCTCVCLRCVCVCASERVSD